MAAASRLLLCVVLCSVFPSSLHESPRRVHEPQLCARVERVAVDVLSQSRTRLLAESLSSSRWRRALRWYVGVRTRACGRPWWLSSGEGAVLQAEAREDVTGLLKARLAEDVLRPSLLRTVKERLAPDSKQTFLDADLRRIVEEEIMNLIYSMHSFSFTFPTVLGALAELLLPSVPVALFLISARRRSTARRASPEENQVVEDAVLACIRQQLRHALAEALRSHSPAPPLRFARAMVGSKLRSSREALALVGLWRGGAERHRRARRLGQERAVRHGLGLLLATAAGRDVAEEEARPLARSLFPLVADGVETALGRRRAGSEAALREAATEEARSVLRAALDDSLLRLGVDDSLLATPVKFAAKVLTRAAVRLLKRCFRRLVERE